MKLRRISFKIISMIMVFTILFGVSAQAISAIEWEHDDHVHTDDDGEINYVSLGDSMTNGYGLDSNYKHNGFRHYASSAYPNLFANWLEGTYGVTVNHSQFAMSGQRVEDIRFTLGIDYDDPKVIEFFDVITKSTYDAGNATRTNYYDWDEIPEGQTKTVEQLFLETFDFGDFYTFDEFIDGRYDYFTSDKRAAWEGAPEGILQVSKDYQEAVTNADIISYGGGNGNFGVFILGRLTNALGFGGGDPAEVDLYRVEDAIRGLDEKEQKYVFTVLDKISAALAAYGLTTESGDGVMDALVNIFTFTIASFMANYIGTMDRIVELNPDVEVILLGLMNTYGSSDVSIGDLVGGGSDLSAALTELSVGDLLQIAYDPLNDFIAGYPALVQAKGGYENARFYYAEVAEVECMIQVYGHDFYLIDHVAEDGTVVYKDEDGNGAPDVNPNSITRERFVTRPEGHSLNNCIVGTCRCSTGCDCDGDGDKTTGCQAGYYDNCTNFYKGYVWQLLGSMVQPIGFKDVLYYDGLNDVQKAQYAATTDSKKVTSLAVYLAFEKAILAAGHDNSPISISSILGLGSVFSNPDLLGDVFGAYETNLPAAMAGKQDAACTVIAPVLEGILESTINEMLEAYGATVDLTVTANEVKNLINGVDGAAEAIARKAVDAIVEKMAPTYVNGVVYGPNGNDGVYAGIESLLSGINSILNSDYSISLGLTVGGYYNAITGKEFTGTHEQKLELVKNFYLDATNKVGEGEEATVVFGSRWLAEYVNNSLKTVLGTSYDTYAAYGLTGTNVVATAYNGNKAALDYAATSAGTLQSDAAIAAGTEAYLDGMLGGSAVGYIANQVSGNVSTVQSGVDAICTALATPDVLGEVIYNSDALGGILGLFARCLLGDGIGSHPSPAGHVALFDAVSSSYFEGHTVGDETKENLTPAWNWLLNYAQTNYPDAYKTISDLAAYIDSPEFKVLCDRAETLYNQLDAATTPEQKERLANETYELVTTLQNIAAKATAKDLSGIDYYVSIGDSTLTGYGLDKYVPGLNNGEGQVLGDEAPVILAQKLFGEDYTSHHKKLDQGGLRVDDLLVWLGEEEFIDDFYNEYTMAWTSHTTASKQALFQSEIEKADLITLALGGGNITTFVGQQVQRLKNGQDLYEMDWTKYFAKAELKEIRGYISSVQQVLSGFLPEVAGVPAEKLAPVVAESFLFGLVGYFNNYSKVVERIHAINPDAHVVIVGYFNPIDNAVLTLDVMGKSVDVPLGTMLGTLMETCNAYGLAYALANENATFVSISDTTTILDEQGKTDIDSQLNGIIGQTWLTHAGPNGHKYIANQLYTAITTEYTTEELAIEAVNALADYINYVLDDFDEEIDEAFDMLLQLIDKHYNDAFALAYEQIPAEVITAIIASLDEVSGALNDVADAVNGAELPEFMNSTKNLLTEKIGLAEGSVNALRNIFATGVIDAGTWETVKALVASLASHVESIAELAIELTEYYSDEIEALMAGQARQRRGGSNLSNKVAELNARINSINTAIANLNGKVAKLAAEVYNTTVQLTKCAFNHLIVLLQDAYTAFVEAITDVIEHYAPHALTPLYNWLYNNPDKVIDFFVEYGDDFVEFVADHHEIIFDALEFVYENFGDEMLEFVLDNSDVILPELIELAEIHGENLWNLAKIYLNAIYLYVDAEYAITDKVTAKLGEIAELVGQLVDTITDAYDYVEALNIYGKIEAALAELHAELVAGAEAAYAELKAVTEAEIAALVAEAEAKIAALEAGLANASAEAKAAIEAEIAELKAALECAIKAKLEALACAEELKNNVKNAVVEIADQIIDTVSAYVADEVAGYYQANEDSLYVSVNGGDAEYAQLLADALDLEPHQIGYTTWDNLDYELLSKADLITIGYDENELSGFAVAQMLAYVANYLDGDARELILNYINDLFTNLGEDQTVIDAYKEMINSGIDTVLGLEILANREVQDMDWAQYVGAGNVKYIDELRATLADKLVCAGVPETYSYTVDIAELLMTTGFGVAFGVSEDDESQDIYDILGDSAYLTIEIPTLEAITLAAESYLYGYVGFNVNYGSLILDIYEMNPDALVVLLGHYNAFDVELSMGDMTIDLSDAYGAVAKLSSIHPFVYALLSSKVAYADIYDAETVYESMIASGEADGTLLNFLMLYLFDTTVTDPSAAGNEYIADQILDILTLGCYHKYDNVCDPDCNKCGELREVPGHSYTADCDSHCDNCGEYRVAPSGHTYDDACDLDCNKCGETRPNGKGHVYDNCEDATCNVCGAVREAGEHYFDHCEDRDCYKCDYVREPSSHVYDNCSDTECNVCGMERSAQIHTYTNACDSDCNRCGTPREVGEHVYDGCEDADCNICGAERTAGKHVFDDCEDGTCNVCGQYVVPVGHHFGDWSVSVEATRKTEGEETRVCAQCKAVETKTIAALGGLSVGAIIGIVAGSVTTAGAGGFSIYWFLIQKKTWAQLLALFGKQAAEAAVEKAEEGVVEAAAEGAAEAAAEAATEQAAEAAAETAAEATAEAAEATAETQTTDAE